MKSTCIFLFVFLCSVLCLEVGVHGDSATLLFSFKYQGGANYSADNINYQITVHAAPNAVPGNYQLNGINTFTFSVDSSGNITVINGPATQPDSHTAVFNSGISAYYQFNGYYIDDVYEVSNSDPSYYDPRFVTVTFSLLNPLGNSVWSDTEIVDAYFYWEYLGFGGASTYQVRQSQNKNMQLSIGLPNGPDQSPPRDCQICNCNPKMTGYLFDKLRGTLRLNDTPITYQAPVGPNVYFTTTYNQANLGQITNPFFANMGPQWTYSALSYIVGNPDSGSLPITRYTPGGGLEYYHNFQPVSLTETGVYNSASGQANFSQISTPERDTHAVLSWNPSAASFIRTLPDGSSEIYAYAVTNGGTTYYFLTGQTDAQGNSITYSYDLQKRLASITDSLGQKTTFSYTNVHSMLITGVTDPFGRTAKFTYSSNGLLQSSTDPMGIVSSYTYDANNFATSLTTPYGTTTFSTDSDANHQGVQATNPLSQTERVEVRYNSVSGILDSETAAPSVSGLLLTNSGLSQNNTYSWDRRQYTSTLNYSNAVITHWMTGDHGLTGVIDSQKRPLEGRVWSNYSGQTVADYLPDTAASVPTITARVLDSGTTQSFKAIYNSTGLVTQSIDPVGRTTNYNYATNNIDLLTVKQVNGSVQDTLSAMTYNGVHEPLTVTDASGQVATMTYNGQGQLTTRTVVVGGTNQTTTMTYAGPSGTGTGNYLTQVIGPVAGATTSYTYDSAGRVHTVTDSEGYAVTTAYDNFDRPTAVTYPDSTTDQTFYKNLDVNRTVDRQGRTTYNYYDAIRELVQTTDPQGRGTWYGWCTCGGLAALTDANGHITTWNRDLLGRVTSKVYADTSQIVYTYENTTSRLHNMTDARGNIANYTYNTDNTLASTAYTPGSGVSSTPNVSFTYDPVYNRVLTMTDGTGTTTYSYNPINASLGAGRLAGVSVPIAGASAAVGYTYDELGRVTGRTVDGAANTVSTTFDALGRVTGVSNPLGAFTYAYLDQTSRLASMTYPSATGLSTTYAYLGNTGDQRLQTIQNLKGSTSLSKFDYTYNAVGTIATWQQQQDSNTPTQYALGYDNADQLNTAVQINTSTHATVTSNAYHYDPAGNRLTETTLTGTTAGQFNNLNQLTGWSGSTTATTVAGHTSAPASSITINAVSATISNSTNFTSSVLLPSGANTVSVVATPSTGSTATQRYQIVTTGTAPTSLTYDANGNTLTDENGNSYAWDALNRLTRITYPAGATSNFVYDGLSRRTSITEKNSGGTVTSTKNYLWIGQEMAEERDATNTVTKRFFPQGEQQSGTNYYYTRDHLGSVREMLNSSGSIVSRIAYDMYGNATVVAGTNLPQFGYARMYWHQPSGKDFAILRLYDPGTGRWGSRDLIEENGGINLYDYCSDDPSDHTDSSGLDELSDTMAAMDAVDPKPPEPLSQEDIDLNDCIFSCLGINDLLGPAVGAAGQPIPGTKRFTTPGSSKGTSLAGKAANKLLGKTKLPFPVKVPVGGPGTGRVLAMVGSRSAARVAGRLVPWAGWALTAYDCYSFGSCVNKCMKSKGH